MKSIGLSGCMPIYLRDLQNTDIFDQKLNLEKIKSWGESRHFDFHKSLCKASSSTRKRDYHIISFITVFFVAEE